MKSCYDKLAMDCFGKDYHELDIEQQIIIEDEYDMKEE